MNNWLRLPGFPPPEKQDIVKFHAMKKLNYTNRMLLYIILLIAGFLLQVYTLRVWPGAVFLICATILTMVKGYDSRVRLVSFNIDSNWTRVDMDKIRQVEELDDRMTKWDRDILDISNAPGALMFALLAIATYAVPVILDAGNTYRRTGAILAADILFLVLPLWFSGIRRILKQGNLRIKIDITRQMEAFFRNIKRDGETFNPFLMLAKDKTGKSVPKDCRFSVTFDNMPDDFYGLQAQININVVEGASYPYFYCVIAAKPGFGLYQHARNMIVPENMVKKYTVDNDAEVIVIRQKTTKTSGYHTKINDCKRIFEKSLNEARAILAGPDRLNPDEGAGALTGTDMPDD